MTEQITDEEIELVTTLSVLIPNAKNALNKLIASHQAMQWRGVDDELPIIYMLYDGDSPDGRGSAEYVGRTTSEKQAKAHFLRCKKDPYSTGRVMVMEGDKLTLADWKR